MCHNGADFCNFLSASRPITKRPIICRGDIGARPIASRRSQQVSVNTKLRTRVHMTRDTENNDGNNATDPIRGYSINK